MGTMYDFVEKAMSESGKEAGVMVEEVKFYTGSDVILFDPFNHVMISISDKSDVKDGENLVLLTRKRVSNEIEQFVRAGYMESDMNMLNLDYEEKTGIGVESMSYDIAYFNEKLRLKMLAGESDYDIVLLEDDSSMLANILRYELYLPLENYTGITSGFDKLIDGIDDLMTYNGHLFGVPYSVVGYMFDINEEYPEYMPSEGFTFDDFWKLCEENTDIVQAQIIFQILMTYVLEDGIKNGAITTAEDISKQVQNFCDHIECGGLKDLRGAKNDFKFKPKHYSAGKSLTTIDSLSINAGGITPYISPAPTYNGMNYYAVLDMMYINSETTKADAAAEYLSLYFENDYQSYVNEMKKSYLAKDIDSYFTYLSQGSMGTSRGAVSYEDGYENHRNKYVIEQNSFDQPYANLLVEDGAKFFKSPALILYTLDYQDDLYEICLNLLDGVITSEQAAEKIYNDVCYRYFE